MPSSSELSLYDTYFYGPMVMAALANHGAVVEAGLKSARGPNWKADMEASMGAFRTSVEASIRENEEANAATRAMQDVQDRINPWRRVMEGFARSAAPAQQRLLLRAAGFGLGTPRGPKEAKDFLLNVAALVDTNLMGARLDPRLPAGVEDMLVRMLVLGEETAVFIAPPGSF